MSLSTQLTRGTLALPMLALFAALAVVSGEAVEASSARIGETAYCSVPARPRLLLAQAPGDLGPIAQRQGACRA